MSIKWHPTLVVLLLVSVACLVSGSSDLEAVLQENAKLKLKLKEQAQAIVEKDETIKQKDETIRGLVLKPQTPTTTSSSLPEGETADKERAKELGQSEYLQDSGQEGLGEAEGGKESVAEDKAPTSWIAGGSKCYGRRYIKTCSGPKPSACTSCFKGRFLAARKFNSKQEISASWCHPVPALKNFNPSLSGVQCSWSSCYDGDTGDPLGAKQPYATTNKMICSRICLIGGGLSTVRNLERYDNPETRTGKRKVDTKFHYNSYSSPVCALHKMTMCTKNKDFDPGNCQKFRNNEAGGKSKHCKQENCHVKKEVGCVAIFPYVKKGAKIMGSQIMGTDLSVYENECKHAINPCNPVALFM